MIRMLSIVALGALCGMLSGCGCSKEKAPPPSDAEIRMRDVEYTNRLAQIRDAQVSAAVRAAAIRAELEKFGTDASNRPEYADLTNRLARCEAEAEAARLAARNAVRARLLKDAAAKKGSRAKGDFNK